MNTALVGQTPALPVPNVAPSLVEGGMTLAIVVYLLDKGIAFFKRKEDNEEKLTQTLIDDLRKERNQHLEQIIEVLERNESSQKELAIANRKIASAISEINLAAQQNARIYSEIFAQLRSQERMLLSLTNSQSNNGKKPEYQS